MCKVLCYTTWGKTHLEEMKRFSQLSKNLQPNWGSKKQTFPPPQGICSPLLLTTAPPDAFSLFPLPNYISPNAFIFTISTGYSSVFRGLCAVCIIHMLAGF